MMKNKCAKEKIANGRVISIGEFKSLLDKFETYTRILALAEISQHSKNERIKTRKAILDAFEIVVAKYFEEVRNRNENIHND